MQSTVDDFTSMFDFSRKAIVLAIMADPDRPEPVGRSPWGTIFAYPEGSFEDAAYPIEYLQRVAERVVPADEIGRYGPCECCQPYNPDRCGRVWYPGWPEVEV